MARKKFLLFDLDGVLVKPGGYRKASRDTLLYFFNQLGIEANLPGEDGLSHFEAATITNEWDMVPLALAMVLDTLYQLTGIAPIQENLRECVEVCRGRGLQRIEVDYVAYIDQISSALIPHTIPCRAVLTACGQPEAGGLFTAVPAMVLDELLANTRDVRRSPTTRIFQQLILGSERFSSVYGVRAELQTSSYLLELDQPFLSIESRRALSAGMRDKQLFCAGLTLRPSLPPVENRNGNAIYSPETELARRFIGLDEMPIIGYGEMQWLAERMGVEADSLIKPAPYQALTALASATGLELPAVFDWVGQILRDPAQMGVEFLDGCDEIELHIFEDSVVGILSTQRAAAILSAQHAVTLHEHGIGSHPVKVAALKSVGATVDAEINQALAGVLGVNGD